MRLLIASVGHKMPDWITEGYSEYAKRMPRETRMELIEIKPEPRTTGKSTAQIMEAEATRITGALPQSCRRIVLDERGEMVSTKRLSALMQEWMSSGQDVAFIIGGADGLSDSVKKDAHQMISLSSCTLPHAFVRVLLAEQLYRAYSLMHNHPYHRE